MNFLRMSELNLTDKVVLIREDLNVPIRDGKVTSDARLQASLPTIKMALEKGAAVIVCSHLGRPTEGNPEAIYSLAPVADYLSDKLAAPVSLNNDYLTEGVSIKAGEVVLLENVRFNTGEKKNNADLAQKYASLCDVFVMDAFGTAHRAQASTEGVTQAMRQADKTVCAGPLLAAELDALSLAHARYCWWLKSLYKIASFAQLGRSMHANNRWWRYREYLPSRARSQCRRFAI